MLDPFRLAGRLFLATFRIVAHTVVGLIQCALYLSHRRPDQIGDAFGEWGRGVTDAVADIFKR